MTVAEAREAYKKRTRRYVVGYLREGNCVYGSAVGSSSTDAINPKTLTEARRWAEDLLDDGAAVFELVPIEVKAKKKKKK